ncbi:hypothetical protein GCM10022259_25700 [Aquimarina mytili]
MWNNFELPKFYPFERIEKAEALVFYSEKIPPKLPFADFRNEFDLSIKFIYKVNQKVFISEYRAYKASMFQKEGDSIMVEYSTGDPSKVRYTKSLRKRKTKRLQFRKNFHHIKENGYKNLELVESLFTYEDYAEYGKKLIKTTGVFKKTGDTIKLTSLMYYDDVRVGGTLIEEIKPINRQLEEFEISDFLMVSNNHIVEIRTGCNFKLSGSNL